MVPTEGPRGILVALFQLVVGQERRHGLGREEINLAKD